MSYFLFLFIVDLVVVVAAALFVCLVGFLTSSSTTRAPRQSVWQFYVLPHMRQSWETVTAVSAGHIILTLTQPVGSERPRVVVVDLLVVEEGVKAVA